MIRIAIISPFTLPSCRGNSIMAERLKTELSRRGYRVALFNSSNDAPADVLEFLPDIVHSIHALRPSEWLEDYFSMRRTPWIITLTGTDYNVCQEKNNPSFLLKHNLEKASAVVVFHNEAYNVIKTYFPYFKSKAYIVPQGVDIINHTNGHHVLRGKYGLNINDIIFLIVAGIRPVKNIGFALDAFIEIEKKVQDVKLLLVGPVIDNEEAQRVLYAGEKLTCFRYLGEKTNDKVRELMCVSDVLINASFHEGMPGAVLEAMAEKLPVLATLTSGNNALVKDCKNGFLVPLGQKDKMIEAAIKLAIDKTLRQNMGNYGRQIVKSDYSVKQEIDLYAQIYDKVLTGQKDLKDSIDT